MRALKLISITLFLVAHAVSAQTNKYSDPKTNVSFEYPSVWVSEGTVQNYIGPTLTSNDAIPVAAFLRTQAIPAGNIYKNAIFLGVVFTYYTPSAKDAMSCLKLGLEATAPLQPAKAVTVSGVDFLQSGGTYIGTCHQQTSKIDITFHNNQCIAFESDFNTECFGEDTTKRQLSEAERNALQHDLDAIKESVSLDPLTVVSR